MNRPYMFFLSRRGEEDQKPLRQAQGVERSRTASVERGTQGERS